MKGTNRCYHVWACVAKNDNPTEEGRLTLTTCDLTQAADKKADLEKRGLVAHVLTEDGDDAGTYFRLRELQLISD